MASSWSICAEWGWVPTWLWSPGQAQIRLQAMGTDYHRDATETEIAAMGDALSEAMDGGALGLSLGLDYEPGLFAGREELLRLMKLVLPGAESSLLTPAAAATPIMAMLRASWTVCGNFWAWDGRAASASMSATYKTATTSPRPTTV